MKAPDRIARVGAPVPQAVAQLGFPKPALLVWLRHFG
jgi:hypothetical protein